MALAFDGSPPRREGKRGWHGGATAQSRWRHDAMGAVPGRAKGSTIFLLWIARNPLKSPESDEGIQENQSPFPWFFLVGLGLAWVRLGAIWSEARLEDWPWRGAKGPAKVAEFGAYRLEKLRPPFDSARARSGGQAGSTRSFKNPPAAGPMDVSLRPGGGASPAALGDVR